MNDNIQLVAQTDDQHGESEVPIRIPIPRCDQNDLVRQAALMMVLHDAGNSKPNVDNFEIDRYKNYVPDHFDTDDDEPVSKRQTKCYLEITNTDNSISYKIESKF